MSILKDQRELHRKTFELTLALYRVTDFFPQREALRRQLREKANEIFGGITEYGYAANYEREALALLARVRAIRGYLRLARSMQFVRPINLTILEREYEALEHFFETELETKQKGGSEAPIKSHDAVAADSSPGGNRTHLRKGYTKHMPGGEEDKEDLRKEQRRKEKGTTAFSGDNNLTERQKKIVDYVTQVSQAKMSDFYNFFRDISTKTIQRDLQNLVQRNVLKKDGEKRWTVYSITDISS